MKFLQVAQETFAHVYFMIFSSFVAVFNFLFATIHAKYSKKILTEPEPDRIGIILTVTGPDYKPEKVNLIRPIRH